jgi:hypothetical protein
LSVAAVTLLAVVAGSAAIAQLTADERKCTDAVYKDARNVGNSEQKANRGCVKNGSGNIDACVDAESLGAAGKRTTLLALDDPGGKCATTPAFGVNPDLAAVADGVEIGTDNILRFAFGDPVDVGAAGDKCGDSIAKRAGKAYDAMLKAFRSCAKGLPAINSIADLNTCAGTAIGDAKAANFVPTKLDSDMAKQCDFTTGAPPGMEDGSCSSCTDGATCAACVARITRCQACKAINDEDGGSANCDLLDDGIANGSCFTCGINAAGRYTQTTTGGVLKVTTFFPFGFPTGGTTIQDVSAPNQTTCVSNTVIPYPGGLSVPIFCVPALDYNVQVTQTGCGIGVVDSNGGSDLTVSENGDTSSALYGCAASQSCASFADSSGEIDITVGDGVTDTCPSGGTGNAIVSIPVNTVTFLSTNGCPDSDGSSSGADDTILFQFPQTLDLTTDVAVAQFNDNDSDGCSLKGIGPAGPYTRNQLCNMAGNPYPCCTGGQAGTCVGSGGEGQCIDFGSGSVSVAGGGTVFSRAAPLHDLLFGTVQLGTITGPTAFLGASCGSPPTINFSGVAHRCIIAP